MSATWGGSIALSQTPELVWTFLTSEANDVNWRSPWVRSVRRLTDGPLDIGTRYSTVYRFFGRLEDVIVEITELDPPRRMAWRQVDSDTVVSNVGSYDLESIEGGTRFTVTGTFVSRGWRRLIDAPFAWYLRHGLVQRQHAQLRAALERADRSTRSSPGDGDTPTSRHP
ncbi:MAG TPA: SRPBCC family protein [Candidatus Eisenbacteria bacterium]|nr:SRPBCC family protein [Candidatus Eisenbacteria bacterium]